MSVFQQSKIFLIQTFGLAKDALHIYVGLFVFLAVIILFKLPMRDLKPILAVLLVALIGEAWDIYDTAVLGQPQLYGDNWHDIWNTLFWPTAIFALARWTAVFEC